MPVERLPDGLPSGRLLPGSTPGLWVSDEPVVAPSRLWARLQEQQRATGWLPLLMAWPCADGAGHCPAEIAAVDVEETLHESWSSYQQNRWLRPPHPAVDEFRPGESADLADLAALLADPGPPFTRWPGLAAPAAPHPGPSPDAVARAAVGQMLHYFTTRFIGHIALVRAERSADLPALAGWEADVPVLELSALLRSWEDRFGARVIGFEGSSVFVSVASPPLSSAHAAHVALEHVLTGAANLNDGTFPFPDYAEALRGERLWSFWWD
ncbi:MULTISPECIES: DUF4253 domain-containing protein [unclassified Streptomyces]|uniref:DUF4253 domain-containing protein n=1 Tax=unclassified Streptomyces TaxID=2593676 RepID=UPI002E28B9E6|nr:DUF4253 domain-containing protein [Streptomyces sp. NBC_00223]